MTSREKTRLILDKKILAEQDSGSEHQWLKHLLYKDDVRRVRDLLGPNLVISPSHETLLLNVPYENVAAMSMAAHE